MAKAKKKSNIPEVPKLGGTDEIAHELRTPLVAVQGYLEMMIKEQLGPLNDEQKRSMQIALRNCERLRDFANELIQAIKHDYE